MDQVGMKAILETAKAEILEEIYSIDYETLTALLRDKDEE